MPDVVMNVVTFNMGSTTSPIVITDSNGPGKTPKALVFLCAGHRSPTALDSPHSPARISVGFWDGTNQFSCGTASEAGATAATRSSHWRTDNDSVINLPQQGGQPDEMMWRVSSVGTDQATISFITTATGSASQFYVTVLFFYGADVQAAAEVIASDPDIGDPATSTALGREPDLVFGCSVGQNFGSQQSGNEAMFSFGVLARSTTSQASLTMCAEHNQSPTSCGLIMRNDAMLSQLTSAAGVVSEGTRIEGATTSTGFTATTRNSGAAVQSMYLSLYLGGAPCKVTVGSVASGSTGNKAVTGVGFKPKMVVALSTANPTVNTVSSSLSQITVGAFDKSLAAGLAGLVVRDNVTTAESYSVASQSNFANVLLAGGGIDWASNPVSMDADGFTHNVNDASAADRQWVVIAIGEQRVDPAPRAINRRRAQNRLLRM